MGRRVIFLGFGGQGTKSAGDLIISALFHSGTRVQGMPIYEPVQMGGLVTYFIGIDSDGDRVVPEKERDVLILMQRRLFTMENARTVKKKGFVLLNAPDMPPGLATSDRRIATVDADAIARAEGLSRANVPNVSTAMAGALAAVGGCVPLSALEKAVRDEFPQSIPQNLRSLHAGYETVRLHPAYVPSPD